MGNFEPVSDATLDERTCTGCKRGEGCYEEVECLLAREVRSLRAEVKAWREAFVAGDVELLEYVADALLRAIAAARLATERGEGGR